MESEFTLFLREIELFIKSCNPGRDSYSTQVEERFERKVWLGMWEEGETLLRLIMVTLNPMVMIMIMVMIMLVMTMPMLKSSHN